MNDQNADDELDAIMADNPTWRVVENAGTDPATGEPHTFVTVYTCSDADTSTAAASWAVRATGGRLRRVGDPERVPSTTRFVALRSWTEAITTDVEAWHL